MKPEDTAPPAAAADAHTVDVLIPERLCTVGGRTFTVRELTLRDALRFHARLAPVVESLLPAYAEGGAGVDSQLLVRALAAHPDLLCELLAAATGEPAEWFAGLPEREGMVAVITFIGVHIPFFAIRLELAHQVATHPASLKSFPGLSGTDTGPRH